MYTYMSHMHVPNLELYANTCQTHGDRVQLFRIGNTTSKTVITKGHKGYQKNLISKINKNCTGTCTCTSSMYKYMYVKKITVSICTN